MVFAENCRPLTYWLLTTILTVDGGNLMYNQLILCSLYNSNSNVYACIIYIYNSKYRYTGVSGENPYHSLRLSVPRPASVQRMSCHQGMTLRDH